MGKAKKLHNKKIAKRNERIKQEQNKYNKIRNHIFQQIMLEKEQGKFSEENLKTLPIELEQPKSGEGATA